MVQSRISASAIGAFAQRILQERPGVQVSGIASRGLYLQPKNGLVIYLSFEKFRGPLTINIPLLAEPSFLEDIKPGAPVDLSPRSIDFPGSDLQVDLSQAEIWSVSPPQETLTPEAFLGRYQTIFDQAARLSQDHELSPLLKAAAAGKPENILSTNGISSHHSAVIEVINKKGLEPSAGCLQELIGLGPGLTPLGDDIVLGILLTMNRWKGVIAPDQDLEEFNQRLLTLAKEKTNKLSFSLFSCGVEGSGDERLQTVLDSFFSGEEPTIEQIQDFLSWGSSSGIAVLYGISACFQHISKN